MPMTFVIFGSVALVLVLAAVPQLGLGFSLQGILGAVMILVFGFLFVTVSSRLTGEVGSSSNPISGMTIATLLLTCLIFVLIGHTDTSAWLTALSIAGVVCIASSNGGTTSQDLKTGYLVGATPKWQQYGILIGTLMSAVVIGGTMMALNFGGTHYTTKGFQPTTVAVPADAPRQKVGQPHADADTKDYRAVFVRKDQHAGVPEAWYLADDDGRLAYRVDVPIKREVDKMDDGRDAPPPFQAPQPQLFELIIRGILGGNLEWGLVSAGALVAVALELMGIGALPVAVGMYLGLTTALPIFIGGLIRWATDRIRGVSASEAESETSPGVLLASGYIAGGTLCGLLFGFVVMAASAHVLGLPENLPEQLNLGEHISAGWEKMRESRLVAVAAFAVLGVILFVVGRSKSSELEPESGR
jgi:uncharacterized oligopeptide transporter (OPT) family protein